MRWRTVLHWTALAMLAIALGLGLAAAVNLLDIPKIWMRGGVAVTLTLGLAALLWVGWRYYRGMSEDGDWD
jgi:hypothetical protein